MHVFACVHVCVCVCICVLTFAAVLYKCWMEIKLHIGVRKLLHIVTRQHQLTS